MFDHIIGHRYPKDVGVECAIVERRETCVQPSCESSERRGTFGLFTRTSNDKFANFVTTGSQGPGHAGGEGSGADEGY